MIGFYISDFGSPLPARPFGRSPRGVALTAQQISDTAPGLSLTSARRSRPIPTMTQPEPDPPQPIPPPQLPNIDPLIAQYINMSLETFRQQFFDEIMATVMDNIKPLQHGLTTPRSGSSLRPNPPPPFDGSRELGKGFLETCMLYVQLRPGDFPDDATKLGWILTFMTSGRALTWRNGILTDFAEKSAYPWESMTGFVAEFQREFYPISADEDALVVLEGSSYFQKSGELVDSYVDRFRELSKRAELVDARTLVIKLRRGLLPYIAEALTDSSNPPASNDMEQWIKRARNFERSRQLQKNLSGTKPSLPPSRPTNPFAALRQRPGDSHTTPAPRSVSNPIRPAGFSFAPKPPVQTPMDVDAARARSRNTDVCRRCGQAGHWAKDCPKTYDVRFMFANELEEYLALARDRTELAEAQERAERDREEEEAAGEDFGTTSG